MRAPRLIKTVRLKVGANLKTQVVSLVFEDPKGDQAEILLPGHFVHVLQDEIHNLFEKHPEILKW